jgi:asparagine synthase (glutamine-hydrolysing)
MRLICGLFHLDGANTKEDLLRAMAAQMALPRLSPSLRIWHEGSIGFAVLDFSLRGAPAPALPETARSIMAADVRLDERIALAGRLGGDRSKDDDALLLTMLERFGPLALNQVLGDFAFASWNRDAQRLLCARDAFGIRPLAYAYKPGEFFAFASFPKALHGAGIVPKTVDENALTRRMVRNSRHDDSLIVGIKRLPPAHVIEISHEGISLARYWELDRTAIGTRRCSPEEAARELRRLLEEAVSCRLLRSGEIGAHLSGGLDSSVITVLAARQLREQGRALHAYSFLDRQRNDITLEDETEFVKAVVEQEGDLDWTPIRPRPSLSAPGEPMDVDNMTGLGAEVPGNAACACAQAQGVGLVLSGWGGDEGATFNGRGAFAELLLRGRWRTLAREVLALKRERGWSVPRILNNEIVSYLRPEGVINFVKRVIGKDADLQTLLRQSLSSSARQRPAASQAEELRMAPDGRENRWRLITSPHIAEGAEVWAQIGARYGVAFAFPLLDRRVVEFSLSLPSELFLRGGFRRRPFRDAVVDVLPERVRLRHLKGQTFPSRLLDAAESKNEFLARIDAFEQNESVCRMIDVPLLRRQIEAFPPPERLREAMLRGDNPTQAAMMAATLHTFTVAEYLEQHGEQASTAHDSIPDARTKTLRAKTENYLCDEN